ncbi:type II CAAX prenyl endopeptidase Rce1 family protein [Phenylobacterium aquaticum]|uniref:CPBP family glutamic-type intramembrane protease n=1 Tax=Phenylobacterium aquaticum TaxID=1763816 RepID=UPI001F5CA21F|nr:CPBP family glutamic-type intramembrane protease [Phenylobacterium aquaticum]MCI3135230.1 hypothetical protein [Phenylobacterium aquaticum]
MTAAQIRFAAFVAIVLGLPGLMMAAADPRLSDLGKLTLILSPAVAGLALNRGFGDRGQKPAWGWVAIAVACTLAIAAGALAVAFAGGAAGFKSLGAPPSAILAAMGGSALTSVLEEMGWAGGGLALAVAALGRRWGVLVLGLVWAAWHLIPVALKIGLFPDLEAGPPGMIAAFVAACVVYRTLLSDLRTRARTWMAAAAGHATPNLVFAGLAAAGLGGFHDPARWMLFPAPGGLVFPALALGVVLALRRLAPGT